MHCPHCDQPLTEQSCPHCQASLLDTGPYCSYCGRRREETEAADVAPVGSTDSTAEAEGSMDNDWDQRVLCSDGNCIGIIGPDGRCKVCDKPWQQESPE